MDKLKIIECPRDAMQGIEEFIPTNKKLAYLQKLLAVGFHTLDFGSFVSPKAVPQMRDTNQIVDQLDLSATDTKLLAIVANLRGAQEAIIHDKIHYLGYPMSISETFQQKNTGKSIVESLATLAEIGELCGKSGKKLVVYISMAFGNPYGDQYNTDTVAQFADVLVTLGASVVSLADTVGIASSKQVGELFSSVNYVSDEIEWGVHLHALPREAPAKVKAAIDAGCRRIDGAILGYGGCPMADNDLVGNINTRTVLENAGVVSLETGIDMNAFNQAELLASSVFNYVL